MPPRFSREIQHPILFFGVRPEYQARTSPCEAHCPAGNPVQKIHSLIQDGRFEEALVYLKARNPFPGITGRVCHHPCETYCHRMQFDQALSIKALERAASDFGGRGQLPIKRASSGKKVAIIGSGPCGLTGAYYLSLLGHEVTIFEAQPRLGGIPRMAIPDYALPKEIVEREIGQILELGIQVRMNTRVGSDIPFGTVADRYDACFIAAGAWRSKSLDIPGSELALRGKEFLMEANSRRVRLSGKVVVMGSGGVAMDCASTALRLGASEVCVVCRAPREKMKAASELVEQAEGEGVVIYSSRAFERIVSKEGRVTGLECLDVRSYELDEGGRVRTTTVPGSLRSFPADTIIMAVGESPDLEFLKGVQGIAFASRGTLEVDPFTLSTGRPGIFAAGDVVTGPSSVAEAIGAGRRAAFSIDAYLRGERLEEVRTAYVDASGQVIVERGPRQKEEVASQHVVEFEELMNLDYFEKKNRVKKGSIPFRESRQTFREVDHGYSREAAKEEAGRCFHCGHCSACGLCVEICPGDVIAMADQQPVLAYPEECYHCGSCLIDCPASAISFHIPLPLTLPTYEADAFGKKESV